MSTTSTLTASYSVASSESVPITDSTSASVNVPIPTDTAADTAASAQTKKEQYLTALATAVATLQESINTGLTERLVQLGVLSETNNNDPTVNTKLRTKIPGQPNNSKKGQTKKQQQRDQQQAQQSETSSLNESTVSSNMVESVPEVQATASASESASTASHADSTMDVDVSTALAHEADQYRPKGGIYEDDAEDEADQDKDEVDLVMEADPGEIDGACLELPKDEHQPRQQQQQDAHTKKRNGLPSDTAADVTTAKKSRGSDDD
ncbi:hypothetical protein BGZ98_004246 [Dissophora globulifera]|nr:hypothetical protein BGZ98_004246 [Dissophora globulifera]